jgi:hypothetical protein
MESGSHYVYVVTSLGYVYKLLDNGSAFSVVAGWPYNNGAAATGTSPLAMDATNVYWAGLDSASAQKMFSVTRGGPVLNGSRAIAASIVGAPSVYAVGGTNFVFSATNGKVYKMPTSMASDVNNTQTTSTVSNRLTIFGSQIYFAEDIGKIWVTDTSDSLTTVWSYQDTGSGHGACSSSSTCTVKSLYLNPKTGRVYYGDQDGHIYAVSRSGSTANGALVSGYPIRPTGGSSSDSFVSAPVYIDGVIVYGSSTGKVFVIDQQNASSAPALIQMYHFGSAVSSIAFDNRGTAAGQFMIGTNDGHLYYLDYVTDPTPANN